MTTNGTKPQLDPIKILGITRELIEAHKGCSSGAGQFEKIFPRGMKITVHNLYKAHRSEAVDFNWGNSALVLEKDKHKVMQRYDEVSKRNTGWSAPDEVKVFTGDFNEVEEKLSKERDDKLEKALEDEYLLVRSAEQRQIRELKKLRRDFNSRQAKINEEYYAAVRDPNNRIKKETEVAAEKLAKSLKPYEKKRDLGVDKFFGGREFEFFRWFAPKLRSYLKSWQKRVKEYKRKGGDAVDYTDFHSKVCECSEDYYCTRVQAIWNILHPKSKTIVRG